MLAAGRAVVRSPWALGCHRRNAIHDRHRPRSTITPLPNPPPQGGRGRDLGLALSCLAFGAITAFVTLLFATRGWRPEWPGVTAFAVAFIAARAAFGHLADRVGGAEAAQLLRAPPLARD